jgi:hypothetical protein
MTLEDQVRKAMWGVTHDEQNCFIHYMKENPQLFIDYATELLDYIPPEVEAEARAILREEWEADGGPLVMSAISRDLYIDKRWDWRVAEARARIAKRMED